jgi:hypothetical protein
MTTRRVAHPRTLRGSQSWRHTRRELERTPAATQPPVYLTPTTG